MNVNEMAMEQEKIEKAKEMLTLDSESEREMEKEEEEGWWVEREDEGMCVLSIGPEIRSQSRRRRAYERHSHDATSFLPLLFAE